MDPRIEIIARAICKADGLDPDARITDPDYVDGLRSGHHSEIAQWETRAPEANRFILMHEALTSTASMSLA